MIGYKHGLRDAPRFYYSFYHNQRASSIMSSFIALAILVSGHVARADVPLTTKTGSELCQSTQTTCTIACNGKRPLSYSCDPKSLMWDCRCTGTPSLKDNQFPIPMDMCRTAFDNCMTKCKTDGKPLEISQVECTEDCVSTYSCDTNAPVTTKVSGSKTTTGFKRRGASSNATAPLTGGILGLSTFAVLASFFL